jgi:methanol--5-hydroxybenzimidazolylcobamide Co-methyltransferase
MIVPSRELAISRPDDLIFGRCPKPLTTRRGMVLGGGTVYPELNFTLPPMLVTEQTFNQVRQHYKMIVTGALERAVDLQAPGVALEFETVPDMTARPQWAIDLCCILLEEMENFHAKHGLKSVLRMTPNDNREMVRPPAMRSGQHWDNMLRTFEGCASAGAELLAIESVGGKEVHDLALQYADIRQAIFALCVMGVRDMRFLWTNIVRIARQHGVHAAGDTACGFGNTAMVLADRKMIPKVFAAVDRAITAVRSLVAYDCGAVGPGKDCGYENPILKAITGYPMAMEGKTSACAHLSPMGNLPMAYGDLWSNESVQNIKLLGGMAPTVYMEQLIYDCRLLNQASADGKLAARTLRNWLVESDAGLDPQAYILAPDNCIAIAQTIVDAADSYQAGRNVAMQAIEILRQGRKDGRLQIEDRDFAYLDIMQQAVESMPDTEGQFITEMMQEVDTSKFIAADYDIDTDAIPCGTN